MPQPDLQEAQVRSSIVIASFDGYKSGGKIAYMTGARARYRVVEVLKTQSDHSGWNLKAGKTIEVRYDFHDGSPCLPLAGWRFDEQSMPALGTKWILLLSNCCDGVYLTFRGDFGRMEYCRKNLNKLKSGESE